MITVHLHTPESPDVEEHAVAALSDAEAINLPSQYFECAAEPIALHLVNELAYDAFRLAVSNGHILPENIRVRIHLKNKIIKGRLNRFGVLIDPLDKTTNMNFRSACDSQVEQILTNACSRIRREREAALKVGIKLNVTLHDPKL